jgi:hypothetical protein
MIGERTRKALAAAKARGQKLGGFRGRAGTAEDTAKARKAYTAKARGHAKSLGPIITRLDLDLSGISARRTDPSGFPSASIRATLATSRRSETMCSLGDTEGWPTRSTV